MLIVIRFDGKLEELCIVGKWFSGYLNSCVLVMLMYEMSLQQEHVYWLIRVKCKIIIIKKCFIKCSGETGRMFLNEFLMSQV